MDRCCQNLAPLLPLFAPRTSAPILPLFRLLHCLLSLQQVEMFRRKQNPSGVVSEGQWPHICIGYIPHCPVSELVFVLILFASHVQTSVIPALLAVAEVSQVVYIVHSIVTDCTLVGITALLLGKYT